MGRTESTVVKPPAAFRRDARAKRARAVMNKVIPALLSAHPRARRGIERSELIVDPPRLSQVKAGQQQGDKNGGDSLRIDGAEEGGRKASGVRRGGGRRKVNSSLHDEDEDAKNASRSRIEEESGENVRGPRISLCIADTLAAAHVLLDSETPAQPRGQHKPQRSHDEERATENVRTPGVNVSARPPKVGILNMASPLSPGGGFLNGATSQEESLCMRTTLLPALSDEYYRLPELGVVYTPDVLVFQFATSASSPSSLSSSSSSSSDKGTEAGVAVSGDGEEHHDEKNILSKNDRWYVDVASAAMLRLPETEITENGGCYASPADRELVVRKMRAVLRVFAAKGCTRVVLGAWGCGAYGNPVAEIAKAWRRVLCVEAERGGGDKAEGRPNVQDARRTDHGNVNSKRKKAEDKKSRKRNNNNPEPWGAFIDDIVFAIKDSNLAIAFARAFGEDVLPLPASSPGGGDNGSLSSTTGDDEYPDNPVEVARISELREKIVQLEAQIRQTRNPQMQVGLESVLASLKKQLPTEGVEEDNHEVNDDDEGSEATEQESSSEHDETTD